MYLFEALYKNTHVGFDEGGIRPFVHVAHGRHPELAVELRRERGPARIRVAVRGGACPLRWNAVAMICRRAGCEFSGVETRCALAMVDAKRGRRKRCGQKNVWYAAAERGTACA